MQEYIAKTLQGLEGVLADELKALGAKDIEIQRRAVSFKGDKKCLYKANFWLRTALRILKPVAVFQVKSPDDVYSAIKKIKLEEFITADKTFSIDTTVYSEQFNNSRYVTYKAKDAIVDYFTEKYGHSVTLQAADVDGTVHHLTAAAVLTGMLADVSAGGGEGVVLSDQPHSVRVAALVHQ